MDYLIESYGPLSNRLVFISDGGTWIKNWIKDAFPEAVSVLDYYDACEHLHEFADTVFKDKEALKKWTDEQKELPLQSKVKEVIPNIENKFKNNKDADSLVNYYSSNAYQIDYSRYKKIGAGIIGSGAIDPIAIGSAHRTVVQKRMKQSGQRWSYEGAQNMLNLRVIRMNG